MTEPATTEHALSELVESVLARLEEMGVRGAALEDEWQAVVAADSDERQFCRAAASLGIDPYSIEPETAAVLHDAAERIDRHLLTDFLGAVNPLRIPEDIEWMAVSTDLIEHYESQPSERLALLRSQVSTELRCTPTRPWDLGYRHAHEARQVLGVSPTERFELNALVNTSSQRSGDPALLGLGGISGTGASTVVVGTGSQKSHDMRFTTCRGLWHLAYASDPRRFLLTGGNADRPRTERAFAAEILAPAAGIDQLVQAADGVVAAEDLDVIADHFDVAPLVVRHQVDNQLGLQVVD